MQDVAIPSRHILDVPNNLCVVFHQGLQNPTVLAELHSLLKNLLFNLSLLHLHILLQSLQALELNAVKD